MNLIIGIIGMVFILVAFILDEFYKKWNQDTIQYNVFNIIGSGLLIWYAYVFAVWAFVALNVVWFCVAWFKLVRIIKSKKDL
ncbi:hypothetical protein HOL21_01745 [Candidatus Woesearchaeota archaeon]|jgi:hypothetical protein|nr:hypothetical protein [Candidatus Woesearchaeota archaeon]MBT5396916.1 hypothetical protein [Candidatus Woesearchaeota archaeon]MBT6367109.1 hypothetical protein [Candidatus Woesearchaeota archaeon]MBT7762317.1 hypothetical protein [Candidatus Woesearchaeota archaeon]